MTSKLENIFLELPKLSPAELEEVRKRCVALSSLGTAKPAGGASRSGVPTKTDNDTEMLLDLICEFMRKRGADFASPQMIRATSGYRAFEAKVPSVLRFFEFAKDRMERNFIISLAVELLYKDMKRMGQAPTLRTMLAQFHRVPAVCNAAFPGYYQAGMMHVVLEKAKANGKGL